MVEPRRSLHALAFGQSRGQSPGMSGGKRLFGLLVVLLVFAGFAGLFIAAVPSISPQSVQLPDGTVVRLAGVTYGRVYHYVAEDGWRRIAGRVLPEIYSRKLGIRMGSVTNATPTVFVCLEAVKTNGYPRFLPYPEATNLHSLYDISRVLDAGASVELHDDVGNAFLLVQTPFFGVPSTNRYVSIFALPLVSRKASRFELHVNQFDTSRRTNYASTFSAHNPAPRSKPRWRARPLPQTNSLEDLSVELLSLDPGGPHTLRELDLEGHTTSGTVAHLRILQNGRPSTAWEVSGVAVTDELSNTFKPHSLEHLGPYAISFDGAFSPREARRFRFELSRVPPFGSNEMAVTLPLSAVPVDPSRHVPYVRLSEYSLRLFGGNYPGNRHYYSASINASPPSGLHFQYFFTAADPAGNQIILLDRGAERWPDNEENEFTLPPNIPPDRLNITFSITKSRFVEFIAAPTASNKPPL